MSEALGRRLQLPQWTVAALWSLVRMVEFSLSSRPNGLDEEAQPTPPVHAAAATWTGSLKDGNAGSSDGEPVGVTKLARREVLGS